MYFYRTFSFRSCFSTSSMTFPISGTEYFSSVNTVCTTFWDLEKLKPETLRTSSVNLEPRSTGSSIATRKLLIDDVTGGFDGGNSSWNCGVKTSPWLHVSLLWLTPILVGFPEVFVTDCEVMSSVVSGCNVIVEHSLSSSNDASSLTDSATTVTGGGGGGAAIFLEDFLRTEKQRRNNNQMTTPVKVDCEILTTYIGISSGTFTRRVGPRRYGTSARSGAWNRCSVGWLRSMSFHGTISSSVKTILFNGVASMLQQFSAVKLLYAVFHSLL